MIENKNYMNPRTAYTASVNDSIEINKDVDVG